MNPDILRMLEDTFSLDVVHIYLYFPVPVTNFSLDWESSSTQATTKYKAGTGKDITASIGVHIGLRGLNITLKGITAYFRIG